MNDDNQQLIKEIAEYWNNRIHDLEIVTHPVGTKGFFDDLADYRFEKLDYLQKIVDFSSFKGMKVLEVGCGAGIDSVLFAENGAEITGVDLSQTAVGLAEKNFSLRGLNGTFTVMNGENLQFADDTFDVVYIHGVLQYTADAHKMASEALRVLKAGGRFIGMVYNRRGWLNVMSRFFKVGLEHEDAPVLKKYTINEFREMLEGFSKVCIVPERFPVRSRLHGGAKGFLFNTLFVAAINLIPRCIVRRSGWHLMAFAVK